MALNPVQHRLKNQVLGTAYELSFSLIDSVTSRRLNLTYRQKDKPANVLSFPLAPTAGEILIDHQLVPDPEAQLVMFIHGLLHLAGWEHGSKMEAEEKKLYDQHHRRRPRHRELRY